MLVKVGRDGKKIRRQQAHGRFYCKLIADGPQTLMKGIGDIDSLGENSRITSVGWALPPVTFLGQECPNYNHDRELVFESSLTLLSVKRLAAINASCIPYT